MKKTFFLLLICVIFILKTNAQWTSQVSPINGLNLIRFLNADIGYTVGVSGMLRTTDGGINWVAHSYGTSHWLYSICFTNVNVGYAVGDSGTILKTIDGGVNWIPQISGTSNSLSSVCFTDVNNGYIVGDYSTILKTTDGGVNWIMENYGITNSWLYSVYFTSINEGYAIGYSYTNNCGVIFRTINGGVEWTEKVINTSYYLPSIYFVNTNIGFIAGTDGLILKTIDGGNNWIHQNSGCSSDLMSIYFTDVNNGYAVGCGGTILKTTDGGINWNIQIEDGTYFLKSVCFTSADTGYAVGSNPKGIGTILKTTNSGATFIPNNNSNTFPFSIYPNPTKDQLTIEIPKIDNQTTISITNINGQTVLTQQAVEFKTTVGVSNLSKGIYFIKTSNSMNVQKFIKN